MAFTTAIYKGLVPVLSTIRSIVSVRVDNGVLHRVGETTNIGNKFVVNFNTGAFWVIYSSSRIAFKVNGNDLSATTIANTVLKTALLGTSDVSSYWDNYALGYVESGEVKYQINDNVAELQYVWHILGSNTTLMYALGHHIEHLVDPIKTGIKAYTVKGEMQAIAGSSWVMRIPLSNISWSANNKIDANKKEAILNALRDDQYLKATAPDPYWFGLELARSARLALIADELGEEEIATNIRKSMKEAVIPWLEGNLILSKRI
jgi:endoglucanase Acf2